MSCCVIVVWGLDGGMRRRESRGEEGKEEEGDAADRKRARRLILQFSYITAPAPPSYTLPPLPSHPAARPVYK